MPRYFTHYWSSLQNDLQGQVDAGNQMEHSPGSEFLKRGVAVGDVVYIITVIKGTLHVLGKLKVGEIISGEFEDATGRAAARFGCGRDELWGGTEHLIASECTPTVIVPIPDDITRQVAFLSPDGKRKTPVYTSDSRLDRQTFRSVRRLSPASARVLDSYLPLSGPLKIPSIGADFSEAQTTLTAIEGVVEEAKQFRRSRNRKLRGQALDMSNGVCEACQTDFSVLLDGLGTRVLQVHHCKPLSSYDVPKGTTISDLAVVCANCHLLLHLHSERVLSISQLQKLLKVDTKRLTSRNGGVKS